MFVEGKEDKLKRWIDFGMLRLNAERFICGAAVLQWKECVGR